ncbi:MAG TPA: pectate lyase [Sphingomicrobium sp.]|nr:pectate lyase [Sphingomicrobium sp.]
MRIIGSALLLLSIVAGPSGATAMPLIKGWAQTDGGRGGAIVRVTNLNADGVGSFKAAVERKGPRIVVFEVGGVIDLGLTTLTIAEPNLTIAGQTAPSPGITLIRGGIDIKTHDVIVRHIRVRTGASGQAKRSGWEADSMSTVGAYNVIVDHCTMTWGLDENLSASGPRFSGKTLADWRKGTSHNITFSYNILAESLADSSHPKGEHSKGSLIHDNATGILIARNLYAHNYERNPLLKGGAQVALVNNVIFNPGAQAVHYNLMDLEWTGQRPVAGELTAVGNVLRSGFSTRDDIAFLSIGGMGDLRYHGRDNVAVGRLGRPLPMFGRYTTGPARIIETDRPTVWPAGLTALPATEVETHVLRFAGARPWDRDTHDLRVVFDTAEGRGTIIDDEKQVGGYPVQKETRAPFVEAEWNLDTMEPRSGRYPGQRTDYVAQPTTERDLQMREVTR